MDLITLNTNAWGWLEIQSGEQYGGKSFGINFTNEFIDMLQWMRAYRVRCDIEHRLRTENAAVASAYEQYQTTLKLVAGSEVI